LGFGRLQKSYPLGPWTLSECGSLLFQWGKKERRGQDQDEQGLCTNIAVAKLEGLALRKKSRWGVFVPLAGD